MAPVTRPRDYLSLFLGSSLLARPTSAAVGNGSLAASFATSVFLLDLPSVVSFETIGLAQPSDQNVTRTSIVVTARAAALVRFGEQWITVSPSLVEMNSLFVRKQRIEAIACFVRTGRRQRYDTACRINT